MTIAMCFVVPEGIVLGADSTSSVFYDKTGFHYFNHNQKVFEIGENSTLGIVTWGLGGLNELSYRTLIALLDDDLQTNPAGTVQQVAERWANLIWTHYSTTFATEMATVAALQARPPFVAGAAPPAPNALTEAEHKELRHLLGSLHVGFCIAGYVVPDRTPKAFEVQVSPAYSAAPTPRALAEISFWGAPNFILRLLNGWDHDLRAEILSSGKWSGNDAELDAVLNQSALQVGATTLRDAIDFVYSSIHSTIKALKFSSLNQICGGPIEIAVISTDRRFRWVRHKRWDAAIVEGDIA